MKTRVCLKYFVNDCSCKISASTDNFDIWAKKRKKWVFLVENGKEVKSTTEF